jgi:hypothetical protein
VPFLEESLVPGRPVESPAESVAQANGVVLAGVNGFKCGELVFDEIRTCGLSIRSRVDFRSSLPFITACMNVVKSRSVVYMEPAA